MRPVRRMIGSAARRMLGTLTEVRTTEPVVALTFDDGPNPEVTPRVVEILGRRNARGTFFMVGEAAARHPDVVRLVRQEGHAIGGHSWDHRSFPSLPGRERRKQMRASDQAIGENVDRLFRPPYGDQSVRSRLDAWYRGYEVVGWGIDSADWCEERRDVIADLVIKRLRPGCIVLCHDALFDHMRAHSSLQPKCTDRQAALAALEDILEYAGKDFRFVTIPELLRAGTPCRDYWFRDNSSTSEVSLPPDCTAR